MKYSADFDENHPRRFRITTARLGNDLTVTEIGYNTVPASKKQILQRDTYILHYITDGRGVFNHQAFDKNCGYLVVPGERERIEAMPNEHYESYWVMFRGSAAEKFVRLCGLPNHNCVFPFHKTRECAEVIKKVLDLAEPKNEYEEASLLHAAFFEIVAIHLRDREQRPDVPLRIAHKMKSYMDENYHMTVSVEAFAKKHGVSRNYLYTLFKKEYGVSPKEYLTQLRLEKAKRLLASETEHLSVSEVAFAVGFSDPLYFSRLFRKEVGVSPSKYSRG